MDQKILKTKFTFEKENIISMKALQRYTIKMTMLFLAMFVIMSNDINAQCTDAPSSWANAYTLPGVDNGCCVSQIEVYDFEGNYYFWLPYDVDNCPADGPEISTLYDCEGIEICTTENLTGGNSCDDLGLILDGSGTIIWQNDCTVNPCIDPAQIDFD